MRAEFSPLSPDVHPFPKRPSQTDAHVPQQPGSDVRYDPNRDAHNGVSAPHPDAVPFLDGIALDFGPRALLADFFMDADAQIRDRGLTLTFEPLDTLVAINNANRATWIPLLPIFNPAFGMRPEDAFCLVARSADGRARATQAARLFHWTDSHFKAEMESLRIFYANPEAQAKPGEACAVTVPDADAIRGLVVFSGGVWCDPMVRGQGLTAILPRISRALGLTRWSSDTTMTFFAESVDKSGVPRRAGYDPVAYDLVFANNHLAGVRVGVARIATRDAIADLERVLSTRRAQVDAALDRRTG